MEVDNKVDGPLKRVHQKVHDSIEMADLHRYVTVLLEKENLDATFTVTLDIKKNKIIDIDNINDQGDDFD